MADKFKVNGAKHGSWIFTSATLSVNDDLHHFTSRLGIEQAESLLLPSPFDTTAGRYSVCRAICRKPTSGSARQLAAMLRPIIEANNGRCFMLCTSHAMMRDLAEQFRATMTLPVLLQGKPAKGNCCSNLSAPVTRFLWQPVVSGKGWTCVAIHCHW